MKSEIPRLSYRSFNLNPNLGLAVLNNGWIELKSKTAKKRKKSRSKRLSPGK
jgi:hypothetical protein